MTEQQLSQAKDKDLVSSLVAIRRAGRSAYEMAMQTGTAIITMRDQKLVRITAEELRKQATR